MVVKKCTCIPSKHKPLAYLAVSQNANLFVHVKLTKLLPRTLAFTVRKANFVRKKREENLRGEFLQLFAETPE